MKTIAQRYRKAGSFKTMYWTPEVHAAAFALPRFIAEAVATRVPVPHVVVIPPDGERITDSLEREGRRRGVEVSITEAADPGRAAAMAVTTTPKGGVVLFSPGAPTPEGEGGFPARSRLFQQAFEALTR